MRTRISCRGIIVNKGEILVVKQGDIVCLPGGRLEENESTEACLRRELHEELGVESQNYYLTALQEFFPEKDSRIIDMFYYITDAYRFRSDAYLHASHAYELDKVQRISLSDEDATSLILPHTIVPRIRTYYPDPTPQVMKRNPL